MWQQDLVIPIENFLWCSPAYYLWFCLTLSVQNCSPNFNFVSSHLSSLVSLHFRGAGFSVCQPRAGCVLLVLLLPVHRVLLMAVVSQCLSPEVLVRPGDCKVRAGSSFTLRLTPTAATGGVMEGACSMKCWGLSAAWTSPAQWRGAGIDSAETFQLHSTGQDWSLPLLPSSRTATATGCLFWGARFHLTPLLPPEFWYMLQQHSPRFSKALGVWDFLPCLCNDLWSCSFSCRTSQTLATKRLPWEIF